MRQTLIEFRGANCTWCLNYAISHLRSRHAVRAVQVQAGMGCIEVDHDADDLDELLPDVRADLRGWQRADNAERVLVDLQVHEAGQCPLRTDEAT